jgi:hypothetical protein
MDELEQLGLPLTDMAGVKPGRAGGDVLPGGVELEVGEAEPPGQRALHDPHRLGP